jgi:hypothetical protein
LGDLWGPAEVIVRGGFKYYGTFFDDNTDIAYLYLQQLKEERETLAHYQAFKAKMKTQHGIDIRCFRSDRVHKYTGDLFDKHLAAKGTKRELTPHDTPQKNGAAEHLNGMLRGHMWMMLIASSLPKQFWGLAAVYTIWMWKFLSFHKNGYSDVEQIPWAKLHSARHVLWLALIGRIFWVDIGRLLPQSSNQPPGIFY